MMRVISFAIFKVINSSEYIFQQAKQEAARKAAEKAAN